MSAPTRQLGRDGAHQIAERRKVLIVRAKLAGQLPDPFDGIQVRAVGRQEGARQGRVPRREKRVQERCVMIPGIVQHEDELPVGPAMPPELAQERRECDRIELGGEGGYELTRPELDGPEQGHGLARRGMEQHGSRLFRRHPHDAAGAVLLEVAFVETPEVNPVGVSEPAEFF